MAKGETDVACLRQGFDCTGGLALHAKGVRYGVLDCSGAGGAAVMADDVARMPAEAVFLRRQAYGPALGALFRAGAADSKSPAHAKLLRLISLWVSTLAACVGTPWLSQQTPSLPLSTQALGRLLLMIGISRHCVRCQNLLFLESSSGILQYALGHACSASWCYPL